MDVLAESAADVVADLNERWPFDDHAFDEVIANHVLEHVPDVVHVMEEAWRVLRTGGRMIVRGPHFSSPDLVWSDPTHRRGLSIAMFLHFQPQTAHPYGQCAFVLRRAELRLGAASDINSRHWWRRAGVPLVRAVQGWMNASQSQQFRTERLWSRFVPCSEVEIELEAVAL